jgi:dipeptidyl aminopeptidase/acylaminoacyl peptidase
MKMVEALIRANKPYDLIVLPDQDHHPTGKSITYYLEAHRRYFQEHLKPDS